MKQTIDTKGFYRQVAALVVPLALQNLINVGVQSADVVMLGAVDEVVLSAASLAGQVQFVLTLLFFGLGSGASVLTAQYWGKGDSRTIEKVLSIALRLSVGASVVFAVAALAIPGPIMRIFTTEAVVISEGVKYLRIVAFSYIFMGFTNLYLVVMRTVERVIISTVVYFTSFCINVVLNAVLIFGLLGFPAMGIQGAAIATTTARGIELVITVIYALRNPVVRLRLKDYLHWHKLLMKDFGKYSLPTTMNELLWGVAISVNAAIIGHLGSAAVAANSVAQVVRQLALVVCFGIAAVAAIMVGKSIGAGDSVRAEVYAKKFINLTWLMGIAGGVIIFFLRPVVIGMMNLSPEAQDYLSFLLMLMCVYVLGSAYNTTMIVGIFRGGGDTHFGLYVDCVCMWVGSVLWGALAAFVFHWPVKVVFLLIMCDEFLKIPLCLYRYKSKRWLRNVTREAVTAESASEQPEGEITC